jgi:hypothetical protein
MHNYFSSHTFSTVAYFPTKLEWTNSNQCWYFHHALHYVKELFFCFYHLVFLIASFNTLSHCILLCPLLFGDSAFCLPFFTESCTIYIWTCLLVTWQFTYMLGVQINSQLHRCTVHQPHHVWCCSLHISTYLLAFLTSELIAGAPGPQTTSCTVPRLGGKSRTRLLTDLGKLVVHLQLSLNQCWLLTLIHSHNPWCHSS